MGELPCTEVEGFTGANPDTDPPCYVSNSKKKKQGESNNHPNGEGHSFNNLDMIQCDAQPGTHVTANETSRSEQPTVSMKNPSDPICSPMKIKQNLKFPYLNKCKKRAKECETPADEIPCSFSSPTAAAQNVSISSAAHTQSSHGNTAQREWQEKRRRQKKLKLKDLQAPAQGKPRKLEVKDPQAPPAEGNQFENATPIIIGKPRKLEVKDPQAPPAQGNQFENATPIIIGKPRKLEVKDPQAPPSQGNQFENGTPIIIGKPRNLEVKYSQAPPAQGNQFENATPFIIGKPRNLEVKDPQASPGQGNQFKNATPFIIGLESTPVRSSWTKKAHGFFGIKASNNEGTLTGRKRKRGRPRKELAITPATPDAADESFDNAPLSKLFSDMNSPTAGSNVEEQRGDKSLQYPVVTINGEVNSPIAGNNVVQDPAATANGEVMTALSYPQEFPFVKNNTRVWDTIQSMDVFQKSPQSPHFRPLAQSKDSHREGLAIGYMVTFASVADKTCKLAIDGPRSTIEQLLETLSDLEPHGFDVEPVRDRLNEMLSYTHKKEELQGLLSKTSSEMEKHTVDKAQIDEEVDELKRQIAELGKRLSHAISMKEAKEVEIGSVKCRMDGIKEEIAHLCQAYQALMCKPF